MSDELYQAALLDLAAAADGAGSLADPTAEAIADNPLCGDRVRMQVRLADGRVTALAHEVKGCVLCQASAAALARHAVGATPAELREVAAEVAGMLRKLPGVLPWPELQAFTPVAAHRSRHTCVTLPFRALDKALASAGL